MRIKLSPTERSIYNMRESDKLSFKIIAEAHGFTLERARQIYNQAARKYRRLVEFVNHQGTNYSRRVDTLDLSNRTVHTLTAYNPNFTIEDLIKTNPQDLINRKNFGKKSLMEIYNFLKKYFPETKNLPEYERILNPEKESVWVGLTVKP